MLSEQPHRAMRLSELAEITNASLTKLSRAVDRLGGRGWVSRTIDRPRQSLGIDWTVGGANAREPF